MIGIGLRRSAIFPLVATFLACSPAAPTPKAQGPEPTPAAAKSPPPNSTAVELAVAPALKRAAYVDPPGPGVLGALPPGAALYASVHIDLLERIDGKGEFERELLGPGLSLRQLFEAVGGDPQRAVLAAVVPPSEANARSALETMIKVGPGKTLDAAIKRHEEEAVLIRVIVPLAGGVDPAETTRTVVAKLAGHRSKPCAEAPQCAVFKGEKPLVVGLARDRFVAGYPMPNGVRLDLASPLFGAGKEQLGALGRFGSLSGGPEPPRCRAFDASAGAALCADADRSGELGAALGYAKTLSAVGMAGLKSVDARRIAEVGMNESRQNLRLAAPSRRLLDDGTLKVDSTGSAFDLTASFASTPASRDALERKFGGGDAQRQCAVGSDVITRLLPELVGAFGDAGPEFADPQRTLHAVKEAGWGAWPVMFARSWPNVLIPQRERLKDIPPLPGGKTCIRLKDGRLEIETRTAPP